MFIMRIMTKKLKSEEERRRFILILTMLDFIPSKQRWIKDYSMVGTLFEFPPLSLSLSLSLLTLGLEHGPLKPLLISNFGENRLADCFGIRIGDFGINRVI